MILKINCLLGEWVELELLGSMFACLCEGRRLRKKGGRKKEGKKERKKMWDDLSIEKKRGTVKRKIYDRLYIVNYLPTASVCIYLTS